MTRGISPVVISGTEMQNPFMNREGAGFQDPDDSTSPRLEYLKRRGKLQTTGLSIDEIASLMNRASGECICKTCGKNYYSHPYVTEARDDENLPFLHITCEGDIVKL